MRKNEVVQIMEIEIGTDANCYLSGEVTGAGTKEVALSDCRGGVYGFFIEFKNEKELKSFKKKVGKKKYIKENVLGEWRPAIGKYYPLYWGKDINLGARLKAHTKSFKSTYTIQMNRRTELKDHKIIFGAMLCNDYDKIEKIFTTNILIFIKQRVRQMRAKLIITWNCQIKNRIIFKKTIKEFLL